MDCNEEEMLNILLDDDDNDETLSSGDSVNSMKRKASQDLNEDAVKLGRKNRKQKKKKSRWKKKKNSESEEFSPQKKMILRPNYFVGIRVSNPEIHRMVRQVQENALRMEPALHTALIQIPTLHITLAVAHLPDIDHVNKAAQLVDKCVANYRDFFNTTASLHFSGLKTFGSQVLFADVEKTEVLEQVHLMATDLETCLEQLTGIPANKKFKPHLTVLKISKDFKLRRKGVGKISTNIYANMMKTEFGSQVIRGVQLLSMNKPKDENGYYYCSHHVTFEHNESWRRCGFQGSSTLIFPREETSCSTIYECGHLAMTYTGLASLVILGDDLSRINRAAIIEGVRALQQEDGSFCATLAGSESDMRFVYCAACVCYILQDWSGMDVERTISYIMRSMSYDYGIAQAPELESHGGTTFCAVATLALMDQLDTCFTNKQLDGLRRWGLSRQISGFQGRPNKSVDTCYSFWVGAALKILGVFDMIDYQENRDYILSTQDPITGGLSKWIDTTPDPLHTYMGLCGLSLMKCDGLSEVHPALNITQRAHEHLDQLHKSWQRK